MANVRPKRTNNARVDPFEEPGGTPPVQEETPRSFFASDYTNMHQQSFKAENARTSSPGVNAKIAGVGGCTLETLVSTLASLQYTTKGKVGEDGKFELIFCSPEPVVSEVKPLPYDNAEQRHVRYVEDTPRRHHRHRDSKRSGALRLLAKASPSH